MCVCECVQSPAVECWVGKKSSVARLEPIRGGGLRDVEGQGEDWKKENQMKEKKECKEELGTKQ